MLAAGEGLLGVTLAEMAPGETGEPRGDLWLRCTAEEMLLRAASGAAYGGTPDWQKPSAQGLVLSASSGCRRRRRRFSGAAADP